RVPPSIEEAVRDVLLHGGSSSVRAVGARETKLLAERRRLAEHERDPGSVVANEQLPVVVFVQLSRLVDDQSNLGVGRSDHVPDGGYRVMPLTAPQAGPVSHVETLLDSRALVRLDHAADLSWIELVVDEQDRPSRRAPAGIGTRLGGEAVVRDGGRPAAGQRRSGEDGRAVCCYGA